MRANSAPITSPLTRSSQNRTFPGASARSGCMNRGALFRRGWVGRRPALRGRLLLRHVQLLDRDEPAALDLADGEDLGADVAVLVERPGADLPVAEVLGRQDGLADGVPVLLVDLLDRGQRHLGGLVAVHGVRL